MLWIYDESVDKKEKEIQQVQETVKHSIINENGERWYQCKEKICKRNDR